MNGLAVNVGFRKLPENAFLRPFDKTLSSYPAELETQSGLWVQHDRSVGSRSPNTRIGTMRRSSSDSMTFGRPSFWNSPGREVPMVRRGMP